MTPSVAPCLCGCFRQGLLSVLLSLNFFARREDSSGRGRSRGRRTGEPESRRTGEAALLLSPVPRISGSPVRLRAQPALWLLGFLASCGGGGGGDSGGSTPVPIATASLFDESELNDVSLTMANKLEESQAAITRVVR